MGLRSQADSLALNKALNPNVNFSPVSLRVVSPPPLPYGSQLPLVRLLYLPLFKVTKRLMLLGRTLLPSKDEKVWLTAFL